MSQSKNWCFTLNNPTEDETARLQLLQETQPDVCYVVFQQERGGATATLHVQGYIQFSKRIRASQVKATISARAHIERANGTPEQNRLYCTKEPREAGPWEFGEITVQGKRTDLHEFVSAMREKPMEDLEILEKYPTILAKYPRFVSTSRRIIREAGLSSTPLIPRQGWQQSLHDNLQHVPDPRQISWYFDELGNSGKSYFCRNFRLRDGRSPFVVTAGKHADIYYAYSREEVVFFDIPRCTDPESFPYAVAESFKNGYFLSTKYESTPIRFDSPHVVVFSNFYPNKTKLSLDRWDIHTIDNSLLINTLS